MARTPDAIRQKMSPQSRSNRRKIKDAAKTSLDEVEKWRLLLDPEKTSIADFLSLFQIPTEGDEDFCYFDLYPFQHGLVESMFVQWEKDGKRAEFRIPKSRRRGVSMFWRALFFERILRVPGWRGAIIAQSDDDAKMHLESLHELAAQLPAAILRQLKIKQVKGSTRIIAFRHGRFKTSSVIVKTASARGLGRGGQLNGVLQTERPHWAPKSKGDRSAFLGSCRNKPGNIVVDESTACGYDEFYEDCMMSERGDDGHELVFLPSHHHELNRLRVRRKKDREKLLDTMGRVRKYGLDDERQVYERTIKWRMETFGWERERAEEDALEFVNWRRSKINDDCGHFTVFHREEPTTLEEAFSGAGRRVFPVDVLESWKESASQRSQRGVTGTLAEAYLPSGKRELRFMASRDGFVTVIEPPEKGVTYCWGSDVASGFETHADGTTEADFNVVNIKEVFSGRTVAQVHGHIFPKPFARLLLQTAVYYNVARGYLENNLETVCALLMEDEDLEVLGYIGEDILLTSERKVRIRGVGTEVQAQFGFRTTEKSKEYLIARYERFMAEWGAIDPGQGKEAPVDKRTLGELLRFVRVPTTSSVGRGGAIRTRAQAEAGHDDCVMAEMLAVLARDEMLTSGEVEMRTRVELPKTGEAALIEDMKRRAEQRGGGVVHDPVTGEVQVVGDMPGLRGF